MRVLLGLLGGLAATAAAVAAEPVPKVVPPGTTELKITVAAPEPAAAPITLTLGARQAKAVPHKKGCAHTGSGIIDVAQPTPDTIVVTMMGSVVATAAPVCPAVATLDFDLEQCFEVVFENKDLKRAKLIMEARLIGLLRSPQKGSGTAEESGAVASIGSGGVTLVGVEAPPHSVSGGEALVVNDHVGPFTASVTPGKLTLHQTFHIAAMAPLGLLPCKPASAEFADAAVDPLWLSPWDHFYGAAKKDFGFQVIVHVIPDDAEPLPPPEPMAPPPARLP